MSVGDALLTSPVFPLPPAEDFVGAGIYCIYYRGTFKPYHLLSEANAEAWEAPIYIGKAVPSGARKGRVGLGENPGKVLFSRIREHARSIEQASNLELTDFVCRFLVVEDIWIPLGESLLVNRFKPLWNVVVDGFGNHDPGKGRYEQKRSAWDILHPGRSWADKCAENTLSLNDVRDLVTGFLEKQAATDFGRSEN